MHARNSISLLLVFGCPWVGCNADPPELAVEAYAPLSPVEQLVRASMALRGLRPSVADVEAIERDPSVLPALVDGYLQEPAFAETVKDMHAELYLVRADTNDPLPPLGLMTGYTTQDLYAATSEEPLELVKHVVTNNLPYSEIVTADYVLANDVLAKIYDIPYDPAGPLWQTTHYTDGRLHAGVLSTTEPYRRHVNNGSNFHRGRANFWATTLLCESFADRDVVVEGGVDLTDEVVVAEAVRTNPTCVGCHQALDPMADLFWGFRRQITGLNIVVAHRAGCREDVADPVKFPAEEFGVISDICYPVRGYSPANEGLWEDVGLRPPGYYGTPIADLRDLGQAIARDPRFAQCSARQFYRWFSQSSLEMTPTFSASLQDEFEAVGMDVRRYMRHIVLSPAFQARVALRDDVPDPIPLQVVRPEQYARLVEDLTGFRWLARPNPGPCNPHCWGTVDLSVSDEFGYRAMAGGVDGLTVTYPTHTLTPVKLLAIARHATEAAAFIVDADVDPTARRLLDPTAEEEAAVREQLASLSLQILTQRVDPEGAVVDAWYALWSDHRAAHGDRRSAWILTLTAFLQDPALLYY